MNTIISRGISTVPLTLSIPIMSTTTAIGAIATTEITTTAEEVNTQSQTGAMSATTISAEILEDNILEHIRETLTFNRIRALVSACGG